MHKTRYTLKVSVLQLKLLGAGPWGHGLKTGCQSNFRPRGKTGTEPLTPDMVNGNNLLALTAATPLEEKTCAVTGREPPPRTHVYRMLCSESSESRRTDALEFMWL